MGYPLKFLQGAGLVSMLLIGGVVVGLIAPLPAKAHPPTVKIEVIPTNGLPSTSTTHTLNTAVTCGASSSTPTPNYCYNITTGVTYGPPTGSVGGVTKNGRQFKILSAPNQTAQIQIADYGTGKVNGTNVSCNVSQQTCDNITLTGVQIFPVCPAYPCTTTFWPNNEKTYVRITLTNTFNQIPNGTANGTSTFYMYGLTVDGYFEACSTPSGRVTCSNTAYDDVSNFYGKATLVTTNASPPLPATGQPKNIYNSANPDADIFPATGTPAPPDGNPIVNATGCQELLADDSDNPNYSRLCFTVASTSATDTTALTFSADQSPIFPGSGSSSPTSQKFACTNNRPSASVTQTDALGRSIQFNNPSCQPAVTETHVFTLLGADSVYLSASSNGGGGGPCDGPGNPPCDCDAKKPSLCKAMTKFFEEEKAKARRLQGSIAEGSGCDATVCSGKIINVINLTPDKVAVSTAFPFNAAGPRVDPFDIIVVPNAGGGESDPFIHLITGQGHSGMTFGPDYANFPPNGNKFWQVDQVQITSVNGTTRVDESLPNPDVHIHNCPGGNKGPADIFAIAPFDTLIITWHIHASTSPGELCQ